MITALIIAVVLVAVAFAALVVIAARLDPHGIAAVPLRRADELLAGWLSPPPGDHHKFAAPDAAPQPAPPGGAAPLPQPLPEASPSASPGLGQPPSPAPLSKALEAAPGGTGPAGADPAPPAPQPGRHPFAPLIMQFPGGDVGILGADGTWHIRPLAWQPGIRETGGMPALVRPGRLAHEAWRDAAVNQ